MVIHGTKKTNPDSDSDGLIDGIEVKFNANPLHDDSAYINAVINQFTSSEKFYSEQIKYRLLMDGFITH